MHKTVYEIIKKQNGEAFAQGIRRYDNGIFDIPNLTEMVKYAGRNPLPLLPFLEGLKKVQIPEVETGKNPFELLKEAGYDAFYADTFEKQNSIESYYTESEALCTFMDKSRYIRYYIIHAVKAGADKLNRADFKGKERREDEYGTSVLSIQILKEGGFISIKNRYNHGVENSDNTFNSNPDNIIKGLSLALKREFNVDFSSQESDLPYQYQFIDGKIYKFHTETNHVYFGKGFYIQNGVVHLLDKDFEFVVDNFIVDLKNKRIKTPLLEQMSASGLKQQIRSDSEKNQSNLCQLIDDEIRQKRLRVSKSGDEKSLYADGKLILKAKNNQLTHLSLPTTKKKASHLFCFHPTIESVEACALEEIEGPIFYHCPNLTRVKLAVAKKVNDLSFTECGNLVQVDLPSLETMGKDCFVRLANINQLIFFSLKEVGPYCLRDLNSLEQLSVPRLEKIGSNSIKKCLKLARLDLPNLLLCENASLSSLPLLEVLNVPKLEAMSDYCMTDMQKLELLSVPNLRQIGDFCLSYLGVKGLNIESLEIIGQDNFHNNKRLKSACFQNLKQIGDGFLTECEKLEIVQIPKVEKLPRDVFKKCKKLKIVQADSLTDIAKYSGLKHLTSLVAFYAPLLDERFLFATFYLHPKQEFLTSNQQSKEALEKYLVKQRGRQNG